MWVGRASSADCFDCEKSMGKGNSRPLTIRDREMSVPAHGAEFHAYRERRTDSVLILTESRSLHHILSDLLRKRVTRSTSIGS